MASERPVQTDVSPLVVGAKIKDNDPRMSSGNRVLEIVRPPFERHKEMYVEARDSGGRVFGILARRIHTDSKPRRSGFNLVG